MGATTAFLNEIVPSASTVGLVPVNAGDTVVVALTSWYPTMTFMLVELFACAALRLGLVADHTAEPSEAIQHITTSSACARVPVAGQVNGDVRSAVVFAGLASGWLAFAANCPLITAATPA
jgi:hypothetical protein